MVLPLDSSTDPVLKLTQKHCFSLLNQNDYVHLRTFQSLRRKGTRSDLGEDNEKEQRFDYLDMSADVETCMEKIQCKIDDLFTWNVLESVSYLWGLLCQSTQSTQSTQQQHAQKTAQGTAKLLSELLNDETATNSASRMSPWLSSTNSTLISRALVTLHLRETVLSVASFRASLMNVLQLQVSTRCIENMIRYFSKQKG